MVVIARHPQLERDVALKLMLSESASQQAKARFETEARALARLTHPGIVRVHDFGHAGRNPYLVMELVDGQALDTLLERQGPFPAERAAEIVREVCAGIESAHEQGILHRDLKPANVLLDSKGRARLTDFGLAKDMQSQSLTRTGQLLGTPAYMSPEQAEGARHEFGPATDVHGLGATLYALLSGRPPFRAKTAMKLLVKVIAKPPDPLPDSVDPALAAICMRCLEKDPAARYPSAAALGEALDAFLAGEAEAPPRRTPVGKLLGAALVLALAAGGSAVWALGGASASDSEPTAAVEVSPTPEPPPPKRVGVDWARLTPEEQYRTAWRLLQEPNLAEPDRLRARQIRDAHWLRVPLARLDLRRGADAQASFDPRDSGRLLAAAFDAEGLTWWEWRGGADPTKQPLDAPTLRSSPLLSADARSLWVVHDSNKDVEDLPSSLNLAREFTPGERAAPQPVAHQETGNVRTVALSPDRALVLAGGPGPRLPRLYDASSGAWVRTLEAPPGPPLPTRFLSFSPRGEWVLGTAGVRSGRVDVWETASGALRYSLPLNKEPNRPFASVDCMQVGVAHATGVTVFDVTDGGLVERVDWSPEFDVEGIAPPVARDGRFVLGGTHVLLSGGVHGSDTDAGYLQLYRLEGKQRPTLVRTLDDGVDSPPVCRGRMQLSRDRSLLIVGSLQRWIEVYEGDADPPAAFLER